jgi:hypothetical protein
VNIEDCYEAEVEVEIGSRKRTVQVFLQAKLNYNPELRLLGGNKFEPFVDENYTNHANHVAKTLQASLGLILESTPIKSKWVCLISDRYILNTLFGDLEVVFVTELMERDIDDNTLWRTTIMTGEEFDTDPKIHAVSPN